MSMGTAKEIALPLTNVLTIITIILGAVYFMSSQGSSHEAAVAAAKQEAEAAEQRIMTQFELRDLKLQAHISNEISKLRSDLESTAMNTRDRIYRYEFLAWVDLAESELRDNFPDKDIRLPSLPQRAE